MKSEQLKELTFDEAGLRLRDLEDELFNLRFQHSMRTLDNPLRLRFVKREIAQLKTVLRENSLGLRNLTGNKNDVETGEND